MKIRLDVDNRHFEYETEPMSEERFNALCKLAGAAIGGAVLLGAIYTEGFWVVPWAVGALVAVGLYKLMKDF